MGKYITFQNKTRIRDYTHSFFEVFKRKERNVSNERQIFFWLISGSFFYIMSYKLHYTTYNVFKEMSRILHILLIHPIQIYFIIFCSLLFFSLKRFFVEIKKYNTLVKYFSYLCLLSLHTTKNEK